MKVLSQVIVSFHRFLIMTFYVRDLNNFMTVQDFLFLLLWMIQDFWVVRVSLNQSVSALRVFRRGSVLRFQVFSIYIAP